MGPFRKKRHPTIIALGVAPLGIELARRAMIQKDPSYYHSAGIDQMCLDDGRKKWREKYPDDLVSELVHESVVHPN